MPLNPPSPFRVRPLQVSLASSVAVAIFIVAVAVTARLTADDAVTARSDDGPDAGVLVAAEDGDGGTALLLDGGDGGVDSVADDAGPPDAGEMVTVEPGPDAGPEPDAGPPGAEPPPYDPAVVAAAAVVVIERCARDALRWDPSLGGPFTLRVTLPAGSDDDQPGPPPVIAVSGINSPILESCLQRRGPQVERAPGTGDLAAPQAVDARGVLRADGTIEVADPAIVAIPLSLPDDRRPR